MAAFQLNDVSPLMLTQIITKLDWKSYFRLQQTCHNMAEILAGNRSRKFFPELSCYLEWEDPAFCFPGFLSNEIAPGSLELRAKTSVYTKTDDVSSMDLETFSGIRFGVLRPPMGQLIDYPRYSTKDFDTFLEILKDCRISCADLRLLNSTYMSDDSRYDHLLKLTKEQCCALFKALKPTRIELDSRAGNQFEALYSINTLKEVFVCVDPAAAFMVVQKLLPLYETLTVKVFKSGNNPFIFTKGGFFQQIKAVMQLLRFELLPNLHYFSFYGPWGIQPPSPDEMLDEFRDFNPVCNDFDGRFFRSHHVIYFNGHNGSSCKLRTHGFSDTYFVLEYIA